MLTRYVFSVVPYYIKNSQMVCNASQLTGIYVLNRAKEWRVILYFDPKMVVIQDKSNKTIMYWSIYDLYLSLNHNKICLCVMNETSSLCDDFISMINQT